MIGSIVSLNLAVGSGFEGRLVFCVGLEHEGCRTTGNAVDGDGAIGGGFGGDGDPLIATGDARLHIVVGIGGGDGIREVEVEAGADREFCGRGDDGSRIGITAEGDVEGGGIGEGDAVVAERGHLEGGLFVVGDEGVVGDGGAVVGRGEGDAGDSGREGPRELGFVVGVEVAGLSGIATTSPLTRGAVGVGSGDIVVVITEGVVARDDLTGGGIRIVASSGKHRVADDGDIAQRGSDKVYLSRGEFPEREEGVGRGGVGAQE